ncbi:MAG: tRNA (adenosine(37)-N6)-threonylcarbamoyltransferase complex dimerization subunit type 1 TsaB [Magnetococcales bacterium]|nr:tRNA (adenosine(37)-N6)-threonylcarbamoyltransferase complex dimerization subunit type 1 TsaB [Magnetococcales bacterium]
MKILAMDSSTPSASVALWETTDGASPDQGTDRGSRRFASPAGHAGRLPEEAARLLEEAGWRASSLDLVVATLGPGSFTGVRIALGLAKGMALGCGVAVQGVSTLEAMAAGWEAPDGAWLAPTLDARRQEVYAALYRREGEGLRLLDGPVCAHPEEWLARVRAIVPAAEQAQILWLGDGVPRMALPPEARIHPETTVDPLHLARWGAKMRLHGGNDDPLLLEPLYLRRPEAEEKKFGKG